MLCLLYLKENNLPSLFQPIHYSSQPCESTFRQLRSFASTFSTVANCSVKETVSRVGKIQLQSDIVQNHAAHFYFPQSKNHNDDKLLFHELPTKNEIISVIVKSKKDAIATVKKLVFKIADNASLPCDLAPVDPAPNNTKKTKKGRKSKKREVRKIMNEYKKKLAVSDLRNVNLINYAGATS